MRQARQDGTGWDDRGSRPIRHSSPNGYRVDVLGSHKITNRFSTRHGAPDGGMSRVMSRIRPHRKLRSYLDLLAASDIADPLREARREVRP